MEKILASLDTERCLSSLLRAGNTASKIRQHMANYANEVVLRTTALLLTLARVRSAVAYLRYRRSNDAELPPGSSSNRSTAMLLRLDANEVVATTRGGNYEIPCTFARSSLGNFDL